MARGRPKAFDRTDVLEKALGLFWSQGYEATGMAQLVQTMGIGRQSIYNAFGDKRALYLAALEHYYDTRMQKMLQGLRGEGSPLARLKATVQGAGSPNAKGCMVCNSMAEFGSHEPDVNAQLRRYVSAQEEAFANVLIQAQQAGEISSNAKPRVLARQLVATMQGMALLNRASIDNAFIGDAITASLSMLDQA